MQVYIKAIVVARNFRVQLYVLLEALDDVHHQPGHAPPDVLVYCTFLFNDFLKPAPDLGQVHLDRGVGVGGWDRIWPQRRGQVPEDRGDGRTGGRHR